MIRDRRGELINIGGGIREGPGGMVLIAGSAEFEQTPEGTFVNYRGRRIKNTPEKPLGITGTASVVHAVDWDGDGDFDLIVGDIQGNVYLVPNEGTAKAWAFGKEQPLEAGGKPLRVNGDAGPFAADWDGDGRVDLLVGAGDGSVSFFRNTGTAKAPKLAAAELLVPPVESTRSASISNEPRRGIRSKVCAVDWNGDGRLDLLVGDFSMQKPNLPKLPPQQAAEQARLRKELQAVQAQYSALAGKLYGASRVRTAADREKLQKEMGPLLQKMRELQAKLPREYEEHGWVWLFLRQGTGG
jgi:hypothetical protein